MFFCCLVGLMEFLQQRVHFKAFLNGAIISKCFRARLWDNSKFVARQIDKIGPTLASALVNAGVVTFQKIEETNPRELELVSAPIPLQSVTNSGMHKSCPSNYWNCDLSLSCMHVHFYYTCFIFLNFSVKGKENEEKTHTLH